ncbi:hypothetical protein PLCT2_01273 [Planctomycetaceae bacterium]|nr:hypothetical protein PLCT2_01273 [Planctomycetaceae bacterium]
MTRKCHVRFGGGTVEKRNNCGSPLYLPYHDRLTNGADGQPGVEQLHTHVILPGTAPTVEGRAPFYNNKEKGHDRLFREIAAQHFEDALDATVGARWRELRPEVEILPDLNDLDAWFPRER